MSYNFFRNFGYLLEPVLSDLVETAKHANGFVAYCIVHFLRTGAFFCVYSMVWFSPVKYMVRSSPKPVPNQTVASLSPSPEISFFD